MPINHMIHDKTGGRFRFSETVANAAASDPVLMPSAYPHDPGHKPSAVFCKPAGGGSARVEFTLSGREAVEGGTAVWIAWPHGAVTTATADAINGPVTALRCVSVSGSAEWGILI